MIAQYSIGLILPCAYYDNGSLPTKPCSKSIDTTRYDFVPSQQ